MSSEFVTPAWRAIADAVPIPIGQAALGWTLYLMAADEPNLTAGYRELVDAFVAGTVTDISEAAMFLRQRGEKVQLLRRYLERTTHGRALLERAEAERTAKGGAT